MAEINIERKTTSPLLWVVPLLLLALAAWWFFGRRNDDVAREGSVRTDTAAGTVATASSGGTADAVSQFESFIRNTDANQDEDGQHAYTAEGIRRLAAVIESKGSGAAGGLTAARSWADSLQVTPQGDDRHADMTRRAFMALATQAGTGSTAGGGQSDALSQAAAAIDPQQHLLAQKDRIQAFFEAALTAVR